MCVSVFLSSFSLSRFFQKQVRQESFLSIFAWVSTDTRVHPEACLTGLYLSCMCLWLDGPWGPYDWSAVTVFCSVLLTLFIFFWLGDKCTWFKIPRVQEVLVKSKSLPLHSGAVAHLFRGCTWSVNRSKYLLSTYSVPGTVLGITHREQGRHLRPPGSFTLYLSQLYLLSGLWVSTVHRRSKGPQPLISHLSQMLNGLGLLASIVAKWSPRSWRGDSRWKELNEILERAPSIAPSTQ